MGRKKRPDLQHEFRELLKDVPVDPSWLKERNRELEKQIFSGPYLRDGIAWLNRVPIDDLGKPFVLTPLQFWHHLNHYVWSVKWTEWWRRVGQKTVTIVDVRGKVLSEPASKLARRQYQPRSHTIRDSLRRVFFTWKAREFIWYFLRGEYQAIQKCCHKQGLDPVSVICENYGFLRLQWGSFSKNLRRPPRQLAAETAEKKYRLAAGTIQSRFSLSKWPRPGVTFRGSVAKTPDLLQEVFTPSVLRSQDFQKFFAPK